MSFIESSDVTEVNSRIDTYNDLPPTEKDNHDRIAQFLGLDPLTMTEYSIFRAIVDRIAALEAK